MTLRNLWTKVLDYCSLKSPALLCLYLLFRGVVTPIHVKRIAFRVDRKKSGSRGRFIFTSAEFPARIRYYVLARGSFFEYVPPLLQLAAPDSEFCGFVHEDDQSPVQDDYLIIATEDWFDYLHGVEAGGILKNTLIFIPPLGDSMGYWELTRDLLHDLRRQSQTEILAPPNALLNCVPDGISRKFVGNTIVVWKHAYLKYRKPILRDNASLINEVERRFSDQKSKDLYRFLLTAGPDEMLRRYWDTVLSRVQYCDYVRLSPSDTIIDCGIHSGFEMPFFMAMTDCMGRLWCIDPMGPDFLHPAVRLLAESFPEQIHFIPVALWDKSGFVEIVVDEHDQAHLTTADQSPAGTVTKTFPCRRLDDLVQEYAIKGLAYIKLDLEGAEPEALVGMEETIREFRPSLAVSIYHEPNHMWEIPLYLMDRYPDYNYYLEHYSHQRSESILYAIPSEAVE